jgi:hypothetical protein
VAIAISVLLLPLLSFLHLLIGKEVATFPLFGFEFDHGFPSNQVFSWFMLLHVSSFVFTLLIFLFSKGFWRYLLLIPISYFVTYPFWVYNEDSTYFSDMLLDAPDALLLLLIASLILYFDYFVKKKLVNRDIGLTFEAGCKELFEARNSKYNREIRKTLQRKPELSPKEYLQRLYYYCKLADRMEEVYSPAQDSSRSRPGRVLDLALGGSLFILIALLFLFHWIPENETSSVILGLRVGSFGFRDSSTFFFYASNKMVLCVLGLIWFATCKYWWRWAILSPVLFYLYQFWELFQSVKEIDGSGNLKVLPLALLAAIVVAILWKLIRSISITRDYRQILKIELDKNLEQFSREEMQNKLTQIKVNGPEVL